MKRKLATLFALTFVSGAALAAATQKEFLLLDADKDGFLSSAEYQKVSTLHKEWGQVDKDGDGKLSIQEYKTSSVVSDDPIEKGKDVDDKGMLHEDVKKGAFHNPS